MSYFAPSTAGGGSYFAPLDAPTDTTGELIAALSAAALAATGGAAHFATLGAVVDVVSLISTGGAPHSAELTGVVGGVSLVATGTASVTPTLIALLPGPSLVATGGNASFERAECRTYNIEPENRVLTIEAC